MESHKEQEFVSWLRKEIELHGLGDMPGLRVSAMREAGGVDYHQAEAQSVAFQLEFATVEHARRWGQDVFPMIASRYESQFGPQALVFTSVFEVL